MNQLNIVQEKRENPVAQLWEKNPNQFDPSRNCMEVERIERSKELLTHLLVQGRLNVVDLGSGFADLAKFCLKNGASVKVLDLSEIALRLAEGIEGERGVLPKTTFEDDQFDLVICTDVIGYLPKTDHRLLFSEIARIVRSNGSVLFSSPLDIQTEDPLAKLIQLAETELKVDQVLLSYHSWHIRLRNFFRYPEKRIENGAYLLKWFWKILDLFFMPIRFFLRKNRTFLLILEKVCEALSGENGVSHLIFTATRKPLFEVLPEDEVPVSRKGKKEVWD